MFGGNDPLLRLFGDMHQRVHSMMNDMMTPFGMLTGPDLGLRHPPVVDHALVEPPHHNRSSLFGRFGSIFSQMNDVTQEALEDPHAMVFSQSTVIRDDGSGKPRVEEHTMRRAGEAQETRKHVRYGDETHEMMIGHRLGDKEYVLEKKRDDQGVLRESQKFTNMHAADAEKFDQEFASLIRGRMDGFFGGEYQPAIGGSTGDAAKPELTNSAHGEAESKK